MGWFKQLSLLWIILSVVAACVSGQVLTSTLREGNRVCPGDEVTFTCTIRGSSSLSFIAVGWSSPEYITGQGSSLQLSTANTIGDVETSTDMDGNVTATATVTNNTNINEELVLESMLRITAVESSMVTCRDTSGGTESIEFTISVVPGVPLDITASEISRSIDNVCIILVQWGPPTNSDASDIAKYIVYISSRNIERTVSAAPPTFTTLPIMNCGDDARVQIAAVNRIGCVGMNSSEVPPTLRDVPTVPTDNGSATTEGGSTSTSSQLGIGAIVGITIAVILPTLCFLGFVFGCTCYVYVAGKSTKALLREMSRISQVEFQKNLVDFCSASKKDNMTEKDRLSSVESLSQMMENRTLSKRYVKEAIKSTLNTMKWEKGEDVKKILIYLKINVPRVLESFDNELQLINIDPDAGNPLLLDISDSDRGTNITMANLIRAAEQNEHAGVFDKLIEIMDNTKPEIVEGLLRTMFKELQIRLLSKASSVEMKLVTNLTGGVVNMESPTL